MWEIPIKFLRGKIRTAAWETAPQISLRDCSKEVLGKDNIYVILVKGEYMQSSTYFFQKISTGLRKLSASHGKQQLP